MVHIERINHMPAWFLVCSFRSLRFFKVFENQEAQCATQVHSIPNETRYVVRRAIRNCLMRVSQVNQQIIVLSMGAVSVLKLQEDGAQLLHSVRFDLKSDRVGIFPGFCSDNFPFVLMQLGEFDGMNFTNYLGWQSHHIRVSQPNEVEISGEFIPQIYDWQTKSLVGINQDGRLQ